MSNASPADSSDAPPGATRTDFQLGVAVAILAALVAVVDLAANHFGDEELKAVQEATGALEWYQSKSIKEAVSRSRADMLQALLAAGVIDAARAEMVGAVIAGAEADADRYEAEKQAILVGGTLDGETLPGAEALRAYAARLDDAGDVLDAAMLFLHLGLLLGGVGIAISHRRFERGVFWIVLLTGVLGVTTGGVGIALGLAA